MVGGVEVRLLNEYNVSRVCRSVQDRLHGIGGSGAIMDQDPYVAAVVLNY